MDSQFPLIALFAIVVAVDPLASVPVFLAMAGRRDQQTRRRLANRASLATFIVLIVFAIFGGLLFKLLGVSLGAFKVAGGILLLSTALDMVRANPSPTKSTPNEQAESVEHEAIALVPMAIPLLAGPGAIATVMVLMGRAQWQPVPTLIVLGAITVVCLLTWLVLRTAARSAEALVRATTMLVFERLMGLLLASVAVEFMTSGLRDLWPGLGR
jgi:multiple antibiotic resistance protein